jgi:peptide/nickel transport system substrate-binding protein
MQSVETSGTDTLVVGTKEEINTVDPFFAESSGEFRVSDWLFTSGTRRHPESGDIVPWLFEDWQFEDNGEHTTAEVKLREGFRFADGVPVTADDVVFTTQLYREVDPPGARSNETYQYVSRVESRSDSQSVTFQFTETVPKILRTVFGTIHARHHWDDVDNFHSPDVPLNRRVCNAGPAKLVAVESNCLRFVLRDPTAVGYPVSKFEWLQSESGFDAVRLEMFDDTAKLVAAIADGDVDLPLMPLGRTVPNSRTVSCPTSGWTHVSFNTRRPPLDDPGFRRMLVKLFDRSYLPSEAVETEFCRGDYVVPPVYEEWRPPRPSEGETVAGVEIPPLQFRGLSGSFELDREDLRRERRRFHDETHREYEFTTDEDGNTVISSPSERHSGVGWEITVLVPSQGESPAVRDAVERWCNSIRRLGVPIETEPVSTADRIDRAFISHDFDAVVAGWADTSSLQTHLVRMFSSEGTLRRGEFSYNPMGYTGADGIIERQRSTLDECVRRPLVKEALARIWRDAPTLVVGHEQPEIPVSGRVSDTVRMMGGIANAYTLISATPDSS